MPEEVEHIRIMESCILFPVYSLANAIFTLSLLRVNPSNLTIESMSEKKKELQLRLSTLTASIMPASCPCCKFPIKSENTAPKTIIQHVSTQTHMHGGRDQRAGGVPERRRSLKTVALTQTSHPPTRAWTSDLPPNILCII